MSYLDGVDDTVMDNGLKFPGKGYLSVPRCLKLIPVFRSEVIGAAAAPVHNVFILALKTNVLLDLMLNIVDFIQLFISINPTLLLGTFQICILIIGLGFPLQIKWLQKIKQMLI